jgi:hypothetical protein
VAGHLARGSVVLRRDSFYSNRWSCAGRTSKFLSIPCCLSCGTAFRVSADVRLAGGYGCRDNVLPFLVIHSNKKVSLASPFHIFRVMRRADTA